MRQLRFIPPVFLFIILASSFVNFGYTTAGYENDTTGDASGYDGCDITRVDVEVTYHSHPVDDEILLKITLVNGTLPVNESLAVNWYDYNFFVDTSLSTNSNTSTLTDDIYEYRAHLKCAWSTDHWVYTSELIATRYYLTYDGSAKVMGSFYWNPNTDSWQASNPILQCGQLIGNTVVWDVTGAIFREQAIGTGYVVQGVATTAFNLNVKDACKQTGWIDEFDNMCVLPSSSTNTPSLPSTGFIISFIFIGIIATSVTIITKRRK